MTQALPGQERAVRQLALVVAMLALFVSPMASAKSVFDPDIGWTSAQRARLHLPRAPARPRHCALTKAMIHRQGVIDKRGDPSEGIRKIFHYRWGAGWFDFCDGGRLHLGVVASEAAGVPAARALVARRHLSDLIRFVAVRSTWRELGDVQDDFEARWPQLEDQALVMDHSDAQRNAVVIDLAKPVDARTRKAIRAWALAAPVNVVVHDTDADNYETTPL
jgi:hypothetical protein